MGSRYDPAEIRFKAKLARVRSKGEELQRKEFLRAEMEKYKPQKRKVQASKIYLLILFFSCFSVQVYAMYVMWYFQDLSSLSTLIGATLSEGIGLLGYFAKSYHETKAEEELKLEREKLAMNEEAKG